MLGLNCKESNIATSFEFVNLCSFTVWKVITPVTLLYVAVTIPSADPVYATPTILVIEPVVVSLVAFTFAPTKGAYPSPVTVDPNDMGIPPLGNSFVLILVFDKNELPSVDVIPVKNTLVTPVAPLPDSSILKFLSGSVSYTHLTLPTKA